MKFLLPVLLLLHIQAYAQRYLSEVFVNLDSTIAGIYGTAVNYQSVNQDLLFDFYAPANDTLNERPLIIYIHGGGFNTGTRTLFSVQNICRTMARKGYAVANIDYRLDPNFQLYNSSDDRRAMTDAMHDAKQAIRYFKANYLTYGIDTNKVFIGGESAGAITAMMASYVDKQSEMSTYPMANPNDPVGSSANSNISNKVLAGLCLCGMILDTTALEAATDPGLLWIHGTNDDYIPISLSFPIVLRADNLGLPMTAKAYDGAGHCPWYLGNPDWELYQDSVITDITDFLYPFVTNNMVDEKPYMTGEKVQVSPNPFSTVLKLNFDEALNNLSVKIISGQGIIYYEQKYCPDIKSLSIDTKHFNPGIYLLIVENKNEKIIKKILKTW